MSATDPGRDRKPSPHPRKPSGRVEILLRELLARQETLQRLLGGRCQQHHTIDEFARRVGRATYTVRGWIARGLLRAIRLEGTGPRGRLLVPHEELDRLLSSGAASTGSAKHNNP
jgi:hypothetical protein